LAQSRTKLLPDGSKLVEENALLNHAQLCRRTLARAHVLADPAVLAGYMGKSDAFDDALASFAMAYAGAHKKTTITS
jgi:hypothetical protein